MYSINVFTEISATHLDTTITTHSITWVATVAMTGQSFPSVESLLTDMAGKGSRQAQAVSMVHLDMGMKGIYCWFDSTTILTWETGKVRMKLASMVVKMRHVGKPEGTRRALKFTHCMSLLVLTCFSF